MLVFVNSTIASYLVLKYGLGIGYWNPSLFMPFLVSIGIFILLSFDIKMSRVGNFKIMGA
jgi:hypothetical protein